MKKEQRLKFNNLKRLAELINKHAPDHPHFSMKAAFLSAKETGFSEDTVKLDLYVDKQYISTKYIDSRDYVLHRCPRYPEDRKILNWVTRCLLKFENNIPSKLKPERLAPKTIIFEDKVWYLDTIHHKNMDSNYLENVLPGEWYMRMQEICTAMREDYVIQQVLWHKNTKKPQACDERFEKVDTNFFMCTSQFGFMSDTLFQFLMDSGIWIRDRIQSQIYKKLFRPILRAKSPSELFNNQTKILDTQNIADVTVSDLENDIMTSDSFVFTNALCCNPLKLYIIKNDNDKIIAIKATFTKGE